MLSVGAPAPDFTVPLAGDGFESFRLSARLAEAPIVLAFFPAAFSDTCRAEVDASEERLDRFAAAGATVYGISTDQPFALAAFREARGLSFGLLSDHDRHVIDAYDAVTEFEELGVHTLARRAVVVVDSEEGASSGSRTASGDADCRVAYRWDTDDATEEPDYAALLDAVA